jgi:hypothetical protein
VVDPWHEGPSDPDHITGADRTIETEYVHQRLTTWEQGELGGNVSNEPSAEFPVRVVGISMEGKGPVRGPDVQYREINQPVYVTEALAKRLCEQFGAPGSWERLNHGEPVRTWANEYRMVGP